MRTHLLRPTYPVPAETEPDTGFAANDAEFAGTGEPSSGKALLKAIAAYASPADAPLTNANDDYYLGGYAGI
jgi:hypothetical protein